MSAAIQPQVSIIWGIKDPYTKYALVLTRYALSATRGLCLKPEIRIFTSNKLPLREYILENDMFPK